jgi:hypothetical protein
VFLFAMDSDRVTVGGGIAEADVSCLAFGEERRGSLEKLQNSGSSSVHARQNPPPKAAKTMMGSSRRFDYFPNGEILSTAGIA